MVLRTDCEVTTKSGTWPTPSLCTTAKRFQELCESKKVTPTKCTREFVPDCTWGKFNKHRRVQRDIRTQRHASGGDHPPRLDRIFGIILRLERLSEAQHSTLSSVRRLPLKRRRWGQLPEQLLRWGAGCFHFGLRVDGMDRTTAWAADNPETKPVARRTK